MVVLFIWGTLAEAHDTHLSDVGVLHQTSMKGCDAGSYAINTEELGCVLLYKVTDLTHSALHVKQLDLDEDGDCDCPK